MSKYDLLWQYLKAADNDICKLSYDEIKKITGSAIDHSFLNYKKEAAQYGYEVEKISMKDKTVTFSKLK